MKIGLTRTEKQESHQYYMDWLKGNDDIDIITLSADKNKPDDIKNCDALVLSGGIDIHPDFYGGLLKYDNQPDQWDQKRDSFELSTLKVALEHTIPVLGICRGLQLINVARKGTLLQDLGVNLNPAHKGGPDKSHGTVIGPGTILHEITGKENATVNSAHHQAIEQLGEGLIINCNADDGTVEGIEWSNKDTEPFLLAIQWHPERMFKFGMGDSPASKGVRERFLSEIKKARSSKQ